MSGSHFCAWHKSLYVKTKYLVLYKTSEKRMSLCFLKFHFWRLGIRLSAKKEEIFTRHAGKLFALQWVTFKLKLVISSKLSFFLEMFPVLLPMLYFDKSVNSTESQCTYKYNWCHTCHAKTHNGTSYSDIQENTISRNIFGIASFQA